MGGKTGAPLKKLVRDTVRTELGEVIDELRGFIDQRMAKLSVEINAAVQMVDFSETKLSGQLATMHQQIAGVVARPAAVPAQSTGLELEIVVHDAELAAHRILDAAEGIRAAVAGGRTDPVTIGDQLNIIFEACSFQDLTGQRIRRALQRLEHIERMLALMVKGEEMPSLEALMPPDPGHPGPELPQDEIDRLLAAD